MICVIATIEINEGQREAFLKEFSQLVPKVRAEDGCIEYGPMVDVSTNIPVQPPARDNVVTVAANASKHNLKGLGIDAVPIDAIVPDYLVRVRAHGEFAEFRR